MFSKNENTMTENLKKIYKILRDKKIRLPVIENIRVGVCSTRML